MAQGIRVSKEQQSQEDNPKGTCLRGGTGYRLLPDTPRGHQSGYLWKLPHSGTTQTGIYSGLSLQNRSGSAGKGPTKNIPYRMAQWRSRGLLTDTGRIKSPQRTLRDEGDSNTTNIPHRPKQRAYRECGRCRQPDAKLKFARLATHYCGTKCQREDMPEHRQVCTHMTLKEIHLIQSQLQQHKANHGQFTIQVARLELVSTETHVKLGDLL